MRERTLVGSECMSFEIKTQNEIYVRVHYNKNDIFSFEPLWDVGNTDGEDKISIPFTPIRWSCPRVSERDLESSLPTSVLEVPKVWLEEDHVK